MKKKFSTYSEVWGIVNRTKETSMTLFFNTRKAARMFLNLAKKQGDKILEPKCKYVVAKLNIFVSE